MIIIVFTSKQPMLKAKKRTYPENHNKKGNFLMMNDLIISLVMLRKPSEKIILTRLAIFLLIVELIWAFLFLVLIYNDRIGLDAILSMEVVSFPHVTLITLENNFQIT